MSELGDIMGEDFEEEYEEQSQRQREQANKVSKPVLMEICYEAINNGGFKGEEPRFRFTGDSVDHDVLLMESPDNDLDTFRWPLGDTAKTQGMFHLDQLFSLAFQENMLDLLEKIETGKYYLVVGKYEERTETNGNGNKETYYNINPVRGILPLNVAKEYADKYESELDSTSVEEQSEQQKSESSSDSGSSIQIGGNNDDDDDVSEEDVVKIFQLIGGEAPELLEQVANGEEEYMDTLCDVVNDNIDGEADREFILDTFEDNVEEIPGRGEEDDDSGIDLSGIGSDDSNGDDQEEVDETPTDDDDDGEDPSDWFQ